MKLKTWAPRRRGECVPWRRGRSFPHTPALAAQSCERVPCTAALLLLPWHRGGQGAGGREGLLQNCQCRPFKPSLLLRCPSVAV